MSQSEMAKKGSPMWSFLHNEVICKQIQIDIQIRMSLDQQWMNNVSPVGQLIIVVNAPIICINYRNIQIVVIDGMSLCSTTLGWAWFGNAFSICFALSRKVCSAQIQLTHKPYRCGRQASSPSSH